MEVIDYEGTVEDLPQFLTENPGTAVKLPFWLEPEDIAALGCESEVRDLGIPLINSMSDGTTVVVNVSDKKLFLLVPVPEPEPEPEPEEPAPEVPES